MADKVSREEAEDARRLWDSQAVQNFVRDKRAEIIARLEATDDIDFRTREVLCFQLRALTDLAIEIRKKAELTLEKDSS